MSEIALGVRKMSSNVIVNAGISVGVNARKLLGSSGGILIKGRIAIAALILSMGVASAATALQSLAIDIPESINNPIVSLAPAVNSRAIIPNGTYLYGQAPEAGQLGKEYFIFEVRQGQVIGAFYMPSSEFSCFRGTLENNQMNLTVASTYDNSAITSQLAQAEVRAIAANGDGAFINGLNSLTYPHNLELSNYHPIANITANDQRLLAACQAKYQ
jgi:hypothetical protein